MAETTGFRTPEMNWHAADLPDEFAKFKQYCNLIFSGPFAKKTEKEQASFILLWIGRQGIETYNSWTWENDSVSTKPSEIWERFERHLAPKVNHRLARYQLQQLKQTQEESIDDFMTRCRNQATKCKFRDVTEVEERLIEQLIIGSKHKKVQERLLSKGDSLTLDEALDVCRTYEATLTQMGQLDSGQTKEIHSIGKVNKPKKCGNCGGEHLMKQKNNCPAYGTECKICGKANHWARVCRSKREPRSLSRHRRTPRGRSNHRNTERVAKGKTANDKDQQYKAINDQFEAITFESISVNAVKPAKNEAFVTLKVDLNRNDNCSTVLKAKLDTGAQGNILPLRLYRQMYPKNVTSDGLPKPGSLESSTTVLTAYGGTKIVQHGICKIPCEFKNRKSTAAFFITEADGPAIIGFPTSLELDLVTLNCSVQKKSATGPQSIHVPIKPIKDKIDLISQYPESFDGIGKLQGQYHITLDPSVPPVVHAQRRVPLSLRDDIKKELAKMESQGVIAKIKEGEPTAWVNSLVYRRKENGSLRICLDPKDLNKAILREHHTIPTLEEILPKLSGAKLFSIVDAKCGYWNVELDEESSYLTTFNSPYGRYRFLRMPFGLKMSQDVFQVKIDQTFEGCEGVVGIADDIVVCGKTDVEHDRHMHEMMARCQDTGLKLNPDKCMIKQKKIKFYGVMCSENGVQPDPAKVSALQNMAPPADVQELQAFLGLATYMGPFIQNLSNLTAPLRDLVKKGNVFEWNSIHQEAFDAIKRLISDESTLAYYDSKKEITLQVDASTKGLGATLLQEGKPIAFASKALSDTESRYANIERELLAVVYGCERFHTYLFGRSFVAESDHKPLESIQLKHLISAPPRLQRMLLRLQSYDVTIRYKPGQQVPIADALSRLSPEEKTPIPDLNVQVHEVCPQFSNEYLRKIKAETAKDTELIALRNIVCGGWPTTIKKVPVVLRPYWTFRDEIAIEDDLLFKGQRIVIPATFQHDVLSKLHAGHQGAEKTKLRARSSVFWVNLNKDIDEMTRICDVCQEFQRKQQREPLIPSDIPPRAWHTIGTDLFYFDEDEYLLIADYYSKFQFVRKIPRGYSNSKMVVDLMKQIFSEHGIPEIVRSDNGPHFQGHFKSFSEEYGFEHITSSPHYPRSNGFIESQVKIVKKTFQKAKKSNTDPNIALLCLRSTPIDGELPSPAELLFGRQVQDNLPRKAKTNATRDVILRLQEKQAKQKYYYDRSTKSLPSLGLGQSVTIQNAKNFRWEPAEIEDKIGGIPRSYNLSTAEGRELRRNRSQIRERNHRRVRLNLEETPSPEPRRDEEQNLSPDVESPPVAQRSELAGSENGYYKTRSGRIVKPPVRLNL